MQGCYNFPMMDDKKLEEMYQMVKENNSMLRSARRSAFIGGIFKIIWWALILVILPYLTWLYIQPYLENVMSQYQNIQGQGAALQNQAGDLQKQIDSLGGVGGLQDLLKKFGIGGN